MGTHNLQSIATFLYQVTPLSTHCRGGVSGESWRIMWNAIRAFHHAHSSNGIHTRGMPNGIHTVDLVPVRYTQFLDMAGHRDPVLQWFGEKLVPITLHPHYQGV